MVKFILFICALQTISVPFSQASDDDLQEGSYPPQSSGNLPSIICALVGTSRKDAKFNFSEDSIPIIPDRCEVILYGYYYIDNCTDSINIQNMQSLTSAGKTIWTFVSYLGSISWNVVLDANQTSLYEKQMETLTSFINDNQISGIILDMLFLWDGSISDYADKMNGFICIVKAQCPGVLVGIVVSGVDYKKLSQKYNFDFERANHGVDFYLVDTFTIGLRGCATNTSSMGILPLTEDETDGSEDIISLDMVTSAVEESEMDQSKLIMNLILETKTETGSSSYTDYCIQSISSSALWCADPLSKCYQKGAAAKSQNYAGIAIDYLDFDDYDGSCGCGYFPITNAFIDGFQSADEPCCEAIDAPKNDNVLMDSSTTTAGSDITDNDGNTNGNES